MARMIRVAVTSDLPPGRAVALEVEGSSIALFNLSGVHLAIDDTCNYAGASLCEGEVNHGVVKCLWHGAGLGLRTGRCLGPPTDESVRSFGVLVDGDDRKVGI